ncbi:hypothetical protein M9458_029544 [Cirrhinus mrigala]|uniref:L1 transposable element RRM domain-containing protein n=1 Tax=Cirrhinus mrigala TaxID=683832 RepID=A0ABD0PIT7_CIRMR
MATAASEANEEFSLSMLTTELEKQREHLKEDMSALIKSSLTPIQLSIESFQETVDAFGKRLVTVETTAAENFEALSKAEADIAALKATNEALLDRLDDLENRSRRANLRIINVPEDSEIGTDMVKFTSDLLKDVMGVQVFEKPPELERAHRALAPEPRDGQAPRPIIVCFHRYQEKERALRWARQHELQYQGKTLRFYPDLSVALSKKRATFKNIKTMLYQKGIRFRFLYPARLRFTHDGETFTFESAPEAEAFFERRINVTAAAGE